MSKSPCDLVLSPTGSEKKLSSALRNENLHPLENTVRSDTQRINLKIQMTKKVIEDNCLSSKMIALTQTMSVV